MALIKFESIIEKPQELHEEKLWTQKKCYSFYTQQRQQFCSLNDLLNLWLLAPYCIECGRSDPFISMHDPGISPKSWENDMLYEIGPDIVESTKHEIEQDSNFSFRCKQCFEELRPWQNDELYIVAYPLEEHYNIPIELINRIRPSRQIKNIIVNLYGNKCFGCGADDKELHIDHIIPRSHGGTSVFRNLQPLCEICGNKKGDSMPNEIEIFSTIYFDKYPTEGFEELFW